MKHLTLAVLSNQPTNTTNTNEQNQTTPKSNSLLDKQAVTLTSCQNELYTEAFLKFGYSPKQFLTLIESSNAKWITVPAGKEIFTQGDPITTIA
jgi:hypothetical protein